MQQPDRRRRTPHHRLAYKAVIRDYKMGYLTTKGAIFYAISAMAPPGAPITINPKRFYEQFGFGKSAYYDAIAELAHEKRVNFVAQGDMVLWVPIAEKTGIPEYIFLSELSTFPENLSEISEGFSEKVDNLSEISEGFSEKVDNLSGKVENQPSKVFPRSRSSPSSTRSTRSTRSSLSISHATNGAERETETIDPDFRKWLLNKARSLPQEPALLEQWLQKQAKNEANQAEFGAYQATREMTKVPPPPPSPKIFEPETQQQQRLATLRKLWDDGGRARARACKMVNENPEWGIAIGESGFEEAQHESH